MKNLFKLSFIFILIVGLMVQCGDDEEVEPPMNNNPYPPLINDIVPPGIDTFFISNELKSYFDFPIGSYWIYKRIDTTAEIYDTAIVTVSRGKITYDPREDIAAWEFIHSNVEHSYYESTPNAVSPNLTVVFGNSDALVNRINMNSSLGTPFSGNDGYISYPIDSITFHNNSGGFNRLIDTNDVQVNSVTYTNIIHVKYGFINDFNEFFVSKNIGIVKYSLFTDNTSWELIDFEIL